MKYDTAYRIHAVTLGLAFLVFIFMAINFIPVLMLVVGLLAIISGISGIAAGRTIIRGAPLGHLWFNAFKNDSEEAKNDAERAWANLVGGWFVLCGIGMSILWWVGQE